jgi:hypothetical protein
MKMNKELKDRWVAALRGGDYEQGDGSLCADNSGKLSYCCLGVLCDIVNPHNWKHHGCGNSSMYQFENDEESWDMPTKSFLESRGISWWEAETLSNMNDGGESFSVIATYIEERL